MQQDLSVLTAVTARSGNDVWALGTRIGSDDRRHGVVEHWDGHRWSVVPSPDPVIADNWYTAVLPLAADDVFITGPGEGIQHWNGRAWSAQRESQDPTFGYADLDLAGSTSGGCGRPAWRRPTPFWVVARSRRIWCCTAAAIDRTDPEVLVGGRSPHRDPAAAADRLRLRGQW